MGMVFVPSMMMAVAVGLDVRVMGTGAPEIVRTGPLRAPGVRVRVCVPITIGMGAEGAGIGKGAAIGVPPRLEPIKEPMLVGLIGAGVGMEMGMPDMVMAGEPGVRV